ncbi:UNVERIFIED_CONTAM: hypothetical protein RKD50_004103 [Streptomyces canus]
MTSWTSPRRATSLRYDGSESMSSRMVSAALSSSVVSRSGTMPIFAQPACRSSRPASRARTAAAKTSSAPWHIEMMYDSMTSGPKTARARFTVWKTPRVFSPAASTGAGVGARGLRERSSFASSLARYSRGMSTYRQDSSPSRSKSWPRAWWWASACSRTSIVASWRPKADRVRMVRSIRPSANRPPRCSLSEVWIRVRSLRSSLVPR